MLSIFYILPLNSLIIGWISIYFFSCGHFAINGLFDKDSDAVNPRGLSLRNPLSQTSLLTPSIIYIWVAALWLLTIPLNLLFIPFHPFFALITFFLFVLALGSSILYSVPPIRLKSRPFLDIIITLVIAGLCFPVYMWILNPNTLINQKFLVYGIILSILLVFGIHLPTILTDLEIDIQQGEKTTAVYLGRIKASYLTSFGIILRVIGFAAINLILMSEGLLLTSIFPFFLGALEIVLAINLICKKDHKSVELLWKTVILTSIIGGIIFGLLYNPNR